MASRLSIFDMTDGLAQEVLVTKRHIEAPNWTPDGKALIVNGGGRLFRVDLEEPDLVEIDTGPRDRLNNDHGITPDGTTLIISDSSEDGESCIYSLPAEGGTPVRVTRRVPSWWHGISPDGGTIAYAGKRGSGAVDLCLCPLTGGEEVVLTAGEGHHDGPDFTPDGNWIWFNSDRGGSMQLWRIRPDGRDIEKMTSDDRANWFPHPSPDGRTLVYLSYPPETRGHPAGCDVELRAMPLSGGTPRVLVELHGGQGTINVPSWAPDGFRFAFLSYERVA